MDKQQCHLIGIGGIGMSGLARILLLQDSEVSGSDQAVTTMTEQLVDAGAQVSLGHAPENILPDMTVVYSTAISPDNPEYQAALDLNCELIHRSDLLKMLLQDQQPLAISGTHGKTSTTALLAAVLLHAGLAPSYCVGGVLTQTGFNAAHGDGNHFVFEADESDGTFVKYPCYGAIVTNIDLDHMDHYGSEEALLSAFEMFINQVEDPNLLFWCGDDDRLCNLESPGTSYGFGDGCTIQITDYCQRGWKSIFSLQWGERDYPSIELPLVGRHNALNGAAVFALALSLGIAEECIRDAFKAFQGVARRCEHRGTAHQVTVIDDYAHHPTEVAKTLAAIRQAEPDRRVIALFQPHRYSRTQNCLGEFGNLFDTADQVVVLEVYAAGEEPIDGVSHKEIIKEIEACSNVPVKHVPHSDIVRYLQTCIRPHDLVVTIGAGDVSRVGMSLLTSLKNHPPKPWVVGLIAGGQSPEHEVSISSAKEVLAVLDPEIYQLRRFAITKEGDWLWGSDAFSGLEALNQGVASIIGEGLSPQTVQELQQCDLLIPILHGAYGEDGTIQGFFEMLGKPYIGCDHRSSAVCMDKALTKKVMLANDIAVLPFLDFYDWEWKERPQELIREVCEKLTFPLYVKATHLGSSMSIEKVESQELLADAIERVFTCDNKIIIENGFQGREIEFAVIGNNTLEVAAPGEVFSHGELYDYDSKYSEGAIQSEAKAQLSDELVDKGITFAKRVYKLLGCSGFARVDCFLGSDENFILNEVNSIPGFTPTSLFPKMWEASGVEGKILWDRLVVLALRKKMMARL